MDDVSTQPSDTRVGTPTGSPNPNRAWNPPLDVARDRLNRMIAEMGKAQAAHVIMRAVLGPGSEGLCMGTKAPEVRLTQAEQIDAMAARGRARLAATRVEVAA